MQINDGPDLTHLWLSGGPGSDAEWPLPLGGRFDGKRGEWRFPQGTGHDLILQAAGAAADRAVTDRGINREEYDVAEPAVDGPGAAPDGETASSARRHLVERAVKKWVDGLVDRSARNNLLFFRDLRSRTLDLTAAGRVFDMLAGGSCTLAQLVDGDLGDAIRRAKAIHDKAQEIYEERGIDEPVCDEPLGELVGNPLELDVIGWERWLSHRRSSAVTKRLQPEPDAIGLVALGRRGQVVEGILPEPERVERAVARSGAAIERVGQASDGPMTQRHRRIVKRSIVVRLDTERCHGSPPQVASPCRTQPRRDRIVSRPFRDLPVLSLGVVG